MHYLPISRDMHPQKMRKHPSRNHKPLSAWYCKQLKTQVRKGSQQAYRSQVCFEYQDIFYLRYIKTLLNDIFRYLVSWVKS